MVLTSALALILSFGFKYWGYQHPDPFVVRSFLIWLLLFGPSLALGLWIVLFGFFKESVKELPSSEKT